MSGSTSLSAKSEITSGFDAVIGNPPYVRQEMLGASKPYFAKKYKVYHGMADLYSYFFERGISLLQPSGYFGIIVANKWMRANYGEPLRRYMKDQQLHSIIDFGDLPVFQSATTYSCIILTSPKSTKPSGFFVTDVKTLSFDSLNNYVETNQQPATIPSLQDSGWNLGSEVKQQLLKKLQVGSITLGEYVRGKIFRGVLSGLDEAFVIDENTFNELTKKNSKSIELLKPYQAGKDIKRYHFSNSKRYLIFIPKGFTNKRKGKEEAWKWFDFNYPAIADHLKDFKEKALKRYDKGDYWWEMRACDYYEEFSKPKISYLKFQVKPAFTFDVDGYVVNSACFIIPNDDKAMLGIFNSKLGWFVTANLCTQIQNGFQLIWDYFKAFPIKDSEKHNDSKTLYEKVRKEADILLQLYADRQQTILPENLEQLQHRINYTDDKINKLVYELYELTEEEIEIIETQ